MSVTGALARLKRDLTGEVRASEPMARHTTFRVGGPAAIYIVLDVMSDVGCAVSVLADEGVPFVILGKGSNLLVSDEGYDGAVLVLGREFKKHSFDEGVLKAGAATVLGVLVQDAFHLGLAGLSWGVGIPGTLGGALAMNAGTRHGWISQIADSVTLYVPDEGLRLVRGRDVSWGYRTSGLAGRGIILEATLKVDEGDRTRIRAEMERYLRERKTSQPMGIPSAGSVFLNPEGDSAGRLIESAGCKGMRLGGALVSLAHANFIVNDGGATAADVVRLMDKVRTTVKDIHGVELRPEIRFLGRFDET
ncbi:MAG TPA: UDP-N-acetylmuramate dehydrogenase [Coriobacteriia bacterium]